MAGQAQATDLITLENLAQKLPLWHPDDQCHLYAVVDMGSNGIRFSITSMKPPSTRLLRPLYASRAAISLYDALTPSDEGLIFPSQTIDAVTTALSGFFQLAVMYGVPQAQVLIIATEAMRRASNGGQMLEAIAAATDGVGVMILHPAVETLFGAVMGSRSGFIDVPAGALFLDLGGGSLQMTWVDTSKDDYAFDAARAGESLPYGAARLMTLLREQSAEVQAAEISALRDGIVRIYNKLCEKFPALRAMREAHDRGEDAGVEVYMCGGGFRGYGSMLMHNDPISPYPIPSTNAYSVPGSHFNQPVKMRQVNDEYDGKIYGMSKRRRQQFPAIATVIESLVAAIPNIRRATFCGGSNMQGALMLKMPIDIRESNPLQVLTDVDPGMELVSKAILTVLSCSLPQNYPDAQKTLTVLTPGLSDLFIRQIWTRAGHTTNSHSSFALHDAIVRDPDCPGLTHLFRALLALTTCARWGNDVAPADQALYKSLAAVVESHQKGASFWALYIGAVANVVATVFPVLPRDASSIHSTIRLDSHMMKVKDGFGKVELIINLSGQAAQMVHAPELAAAIETTTKTKKIPTTYKASAQIRIL